MTAQPWYSLFAFLTMWGVIMTMLTFFFLILLHCLNLKGSCYHCLYHTAHFFFTLALSFGLLIFLIFWAVLVPIAADGDPGDISLTFEWLMFSQHFLTQTLMVVDFILCGGQFHKPHIVIVMLVGVLYLIVNACVSLNIFVVYPILTWTDGFTALWVIVCILLVFAFFFLFYYLGTKKQKLLSDSESLLKSAKHSAESYEELGS